MTANPVTPICARAVMLEDFPSGGDVSGQGTEAPDGATGVSARRSTSVSEGGRSLPT